MWLFYEGLILKQIKNLYSHDFVPSEMYKVRVTKISILNLIHLMLKFFKHIFVTLTILNNL